MIPNALFMTQNTLFVNLMAQNTLLYGDFWRNRDICTWRKRSWVSSRLENAKRLAEACLDSQSVWKYFFYLGFVHQCDQPVVHSHDCVSGPVRMIEHIWGIYGIYGDFPEDAKMIKIGHFCCCRNRAFLWTNGLFIFLSFLNYFEDILDKMTHFPLPRKMTNMYIWKPGAVWNRTCTGCFFNWSARFSVPKWTRLGCFCAKDCLDSVEMYKWWYSIPLVYFHLHWWWCAVVDFTVLYWPVLGCTCL